MRVADPKSSTIGTDELRRDVYKIRLGPELLQIRHPLPWPGQRVRFQDVRIVRAGTVQLGPASIGYTHQVSPEPRHIRRRHNPHVIVPFEKGFDSAEVPTPNRLAVRVMAGEKLVRLRVIDRFGTRFDADQVNLVSGRPTVEGVGPHRALCHEVRLSIGRMFHILAEVHEMRRANLDLGAGRSALSTPRGIFLRLVPHRDRLAVLG